MTFGFHKYVCLLRKKVNKWFLIGAQKKHRVYPIIRRNSFKNLYHLYIFLSDKFRITCI